MFSLILERHKTERRKYQSSQTDAEHILLPMLRGVILAKPAVMLLVRVVLC